jgi:colicin import membrane protein
VRGGLATSVVLHAAVLAWVLLTIQTQRELRVPEPEPIAVDLVNASDLTKLRKGSRTAKQMEAEANESPKPEPAKKEAPKPTPAAAAPPPPPPPPPPPREEPKEEPKKEVAAAAPPPPPAPPPPAAAPPAPAPDEQKKLEELLKEQERQAEEQKKAEEQKRAEEQRKAEEQKRLEEQRKAEELRKKQEEEKRRKLAELKKKREDERKRREAEAKKKQFDAEKIAALLNKVPDKGAARPSVPLDQQAKAKGPVLGAPEGRDRVISASERAVLAQIIRSCVQQKWNLSAGGEDVMNMEIKLRLQFHPDGRLASLPQVTNPQNNPYFLAASEGAVRAAQACEPYSLPSEKYDAWRDVLMTFSLRDMLR